MPTSIPVPSPVAPTYQSPHLTLTAHKQKRRVALFFRIHSNTVNTRHIPHTVAILKRHLPSVLSTQCFNECNRSFREEVVQTEVGHLFEHILLRYLCDLKLAHGFAYVEFNGRTRWNWIRDPRGVFHITIDAKEQDWDMFLLAMQKSIRLLERILLPLETA